MSSGNTSFWTLRSGIGSNEHANVNQVTKEKPSDQFVPFISSHIIAFIHNHHNHHHHVLASFHSPSSPPPLLPSPSCLPVCLPACLLPSLLPWSSKHVFFFFSVLYYILYFLGALGPTTATTPPTCHLFLFSLFSLLSFLVSLSLSLSLSLTLDVCSCSSPLKSIKIMRSGVLEVDEYCLSPFVPHPRSRYHPPNSSREERDRDRDER
ncbi:MAG: hypothetical protein BYD32DRAFT_402375 [Podila humilis]|nr:MAG: hypothetical protein BYD32DRAFT_402375 [Podila humilis]